jgi:hypothetical protein
MNNINFGDTLTCAETGRQFVAARDGITTNYATNNKGETFSDEGVDIRERREMLDRSRPFACYVSSDGKTVTGWKGNVLGRITWSSTSPTGWCRSELLHVRVIDCHGMPWHGKGAGRGMVIRLHPSKGGAR